MPKFTLSKQFNAPVGDVFKAFADVEHTPGRIPVIIRVEMMTPGPVGVGTRFKETRIVFKREATETFVFTAFEPNRRYELVAESCGTRYWFEFRFTPAGAGTRVDFAFEATAVSFWAKLMLPLSALFIGSLRKCVDDDVEALRKYVEGHSQAA